MIDEKVIDNAIEVQNFYLKMYKNVYLRKASVIAQRMFQKMVYLLIRNGTITAADLPNLTDSELIGILRMSEDEGVQAMYRRLRRRELFRETIVVRPEKFAKTHHAPGKAVRVFGISPREMSRLVNAPALQNRNQESLISLEHKIADIVGVPSDAILAVTVMNAWRFVPKDVAIYSEKGTAGSLKERYPAHFKDMEEVAHAYAVFRICALEKYRKRVSEPRIAKKIFDAVMSISSK